MEVSLNFTPIARRGLLACAVILGIGASVSTAAAQDPPLSAPTPTIASADPWQSEPPIPVGGPPGSERLRLTLDFMAGYGYDGANATLGFERQGRVGYAIFTAQGTLSPRLSYRISMNPVDETSPLPACGAPGFFYPNDPKTLYGDTTDIPCDPKNGNRRVDAYRGIALDVVPQQGALREAFVDVQLMKTTRLRFGRMRLPIGFDSEMSGSFTAKDTPRIQRINTQNSFGAMMTFAKKTDGRSRPVFSGNLAAYLGEGNRFWDYDYFYFEDGSLDGNVDMSMLVSGTWSPFEAIEMRGSYQKGKTGSKVERLPSYWASKRNDDAINFGATIRPFRYARLIAEGAQYTWGPTETSAAMLGVDQKSIKKQGYYLTAEAWYPVSTNMTIGGSVSQEAVDRADSLIKRLADLNLYNVVEGKRDRMLAVRVFTNLGPRLRVGFYRTMDSNPYPWLSGITPVEGPRAFTSRNTNKWGFVTRLRV